MNFNKTVNELLRQERISLKEKFKGDAVKWAFRRQVLQLLQELIEEVIIMQKKLKLKRQKREPSDYNLHIAKERAEGKTFAEAVKSWKK